MPPLSTLARRALLLACLAAAATVPTAFAQQDYPNRPVRVILPYPAGGVLDALARAVAQRLQARLGQPFVVDNAPGGSGVIGLGNCARALPDGYTLCITTNDSISINPFLLKNTRLDPRELVPVQRLVFIDGVIYSPAGSGIASFAQLLAAAAQRPDSVSWGTFGTGSASHLYMGWLEKDKRVNFLHVPYKGSAPLLQAGLSSEYQVGMLASGILMPHLRSGKITALATLGERRSEQLPNVPTLAELGIRFSIETWFGAFAPPGTPRTIVDRLNREMAQVLDDPAFGKEFLQAQGMRPATLTPERFADYLKADRDKGEVLVKTTGIQID